MSETTKITPEELQQINDVKTQFSNVTFALGDNRIRKEILLESYRTLAEQEQELLNRLSTKYGDGSINVNTGEITLREQNIGDI
jgi:hypothetical protein